MRYHGVDLHKKYATISVRNEEGIEEKFVRAQADIKGYVPAWAVRTRWCWRPLREPCTGRRRFRLKEPAAW